MKKAALGLLALCASLILASGDAAAARLRLAPDAAAVSAGAPLDVDLVIEGLAEPAPLGPPSVGSFDVTIGFDASLLSLTGVGFGPHLGTPSSEALTDALLLASDAVNVASVSLLAPADLDARQPAAFTLVTLSFVGLGDGPVAFGFVGDPLVDDAFGIKLALPEPPLLALFGAALPLLLRRRRGPSAAAA